MDEKQNDVFSESSELRRELGLFDSTMLVAGLVIGTGIFITTGSIARSLPDPKWILFVWIVGGVLSLAGALTYAELGAMIPRAGGQYVFLREAFGGLLGFLFGWTSLLVIQSGGLAALAVGFAEYFGVFAPAAPKQLVAVVLILALSYVNHRGVRESKTLVNVLSVLKVGAIAGIIVFGSIKLGIVDPSPPSAQLAERSSISWSSFGVGLIAVLWTFDGWNGITYSAGEISNPRRNLPLGLVLGVVIVTACYVAINYVYVATLPVSEIQQTERVAEVVLNRLFGPAASTAVVVAILVSTAGCVNATILTGPRIYWAMAKDRLFFASFAKIHEKNGTPSVAIWAQFLWAVLLTLSGTYEQLFTMTMFAAIAFYGATGAALFVMRRKFPDAPRPYRVLGYPFTPVLYVFAMALILVNSLIEHPLESLGGAALIVLGVPAYLYWSRSAHRASIAP